MTTIQWLYVKLKILFSRFRVKNKEQKKNSQISHKVKSIEKMRGAITFSLYDNNDIDIICFLPETENMSADDITKESENFGQFINSITDGLVADSIISLLDKTKKNSSNVNDQLFIENVLFFWAMAYVNNNAVNKKNKKSRQSPMIRPTAVFNQMKQ